jgi:glycosyltransferase involved in cell wall biosynthesis
MMTMRLLVCTSLPILEPSAGLNRLTRMSRALRPHGIETVLVGRGQSLNAAWNEVSDEQGLRVVYDGPRTGVRRHCRAMTHGAQAAHFYRHHLPDLIARYQCQGVLGYLAQAQVGQALLETARATDTFVVADMVERFRPSLYYLLNGVYFEQMRLCASVLPQYDGILGISKAWCDWASARRLPSVWIPSFAEDHGQVRDEPSSGGQPFTITFIGHWIEREKPRAILKAMRLCIDRGINVRMNVLGKVGQTRRERSAMRLLRSDPVLQKAVHFHGFVSDAERNRHLAEADAFILLRPDSRETDMLFPTRLPEYMLTANPVILSQVGSFPYCFEHRRDVWFVSKANAPHEIAEAIAQLAHDPDERHAIGQRGRQTALEQFSLDVLGERLARFLADMPAAARA